MSGVHDLGGRRDLGPVPVQDDRTGFRAPWEGRVLAIMGVLQARGAFDLDAFRLAIERMDPERYFSAGYYGRWLDALRRLLEERDGLGDGELARRAEALAAGHSAPPAEPEHLAREPRGGGYTRELAAPPRFAPGDRVRTARRPGSRHTRLPGYAEGRTGRVERVHPACVLPDTNAEGLGECPEHLYHVRFDAAELWGAFAEPGASVGLDLFESYLHPAR